MWGWGIGAAIVAAIGGVVVLSAKAATETCETCQDAVDNRPHSHH